MRAILLFILFTFSLSASAGSPVWLIESAQNRVYLAGTIHILRSSDYPLPGALHQAFGQSDILAFETDIDSNKDPAFAQQMLQLMLLPENTRLDQIVNAETLNQLKQYLKTNGMDLKQFAAFKPAMIAITLTIMELKKLGVGNQGVDEYFYQLARQQGKQTVALETPQQQLEFLSQMGKGQEDMMIRQTLDDIKTLQTQFDDMVTHWRNADTSELESLFITPMRKDFEPIYQQLLVQRNQNWMPRIKQFLKSPQTEMILVGTAHLIGPDGLLKNLKQAGYRVTQLESSP